MKKAVNSETRAACCMLCVTMTIVKSLLELEDELLDLGRRDRVERRAGLVHQQDLGLDGEGAGDAEPLLLAAGKSQGRGLEPVLDLVPERGARAAPSRRARRICRAAELCC